jgi:hypothetical protein
MTQETTNSVTMNVQFKGIELLNGYINTPAPEIALNNFSFNVNIQTDVDAAQKLVFVIVSVQINTADQLHTLGSLVASCIYTVSNFAEVVSVKEGKHVMPTAVTDMFNSISISTTRGLMFSTFKGTFLHNAILPIIVPASFQQLETATGEQIKTVSDSKQS